MSDKPDGDTNPRLHAQRAISCSKQQTGEISDSGTNPKLLEAIMRVTSIIDDLLNTFAAYA